MTPSKQQKVSDPAVDSRRAKFEQFRAKPQFDVWRISQQQAFKIFDAGWQAGREELLLALRKIEDGDSDHFCDCEHDTPDCCTNVGYFCPHCIAGRVRVGALLGEKP
jgi:hypothetical protein